MRTILALTFLLAQALPTTAAEWEPVTTDLLKSEKTGFGGLCGVAVDRGMGDVYVNLSDRGLFLSQDQGKTWNRPKGIELFKGRTETPGCMMFDPVAGSRHLLVALVYGAPTTIFGAGPEHRSFDKKCSHIDWAAVDWTENGGKFVLAAEGTKSGGLLYVSHDGGKTFTDVGKGYGPAWIFDAKTAVAAEMKSKEKAKPGLVRTTDGGKTWKPCGDYSAQALPKWRDGTLYWVVDGALIASADKGETWKKINDVKDGRYGPIFGKTTKHLFILTQAGIIEEQRRRKYDVDETAALPVPKELKGVSSLTWLDYDPVNDVLYVMKMGTELYKMGVRKWSRYRYRLASFRESAVPVLKR